MIIRITCKTKLKAAERDAFKRDASAIGPIYRCVDRERVAAIMNRLMPKTVSRVDARHLGPEMVVHEFIVRKVAGELKLLVAIEHMHTVVLASDLLDTTLFEPVAFDIPALGDHLVGKNGRRFYVTNTDEIGFLSLSEYGNDNRFATGYRINLRDIYHGTYARANRPARIKLRVKAFKTRNFRYNLIARLKDTASANVRWESQEDYEMRKHFGAFGFPAPWTSLKRGRHLGSMRAFHS